MDVRVIVPDKSDNPVVDFATLWFMEQLDGVGIRFYRHMPGFMHQKVFLVDDDVSTVGSTNFDNRSFRLQFEVNALFVDKPFALEIEKMLLNDLEQSEPYDPAIAQRRLVPETSRRLGRSAHGAASLRQTY